MPVYLDNAATSFPKPDTVYRAVDQALREIGVGPGRGGYRRGLEAGRVVFRAREAVSGLVGAKDSERVVFTHNATEALNLAVRDNLIVTLCVGLSNFIWLPIGGAISDRIGRRPLLILMPLLAILTAYPAMLWLVAAPSFGKLLLVLLWFSFFYGAYNGAMIPFLTEIMPPEVRTAGFSLAYSLATAIFGGFTPAVCVWLIEVSGNRASPALWLSSGAAISLIAAFLSWRLAEKARSLDTIS